jgi:hypothetical protein
MEKTWSTSVCKIYYPCTISAFMCPPFTYKLPFKFPFLFSWCENLTTDALFVLPYLTFYRYPFKFELTCSGCKIKWSSEILVHICNHWTKFTRRAHFYRFFHFIKNLGNFETQFLLSLIFFLYFSSIFSSFFFHHFLICHPKQHRLIKKPTQPPFTSILKYTPTPYRWLWKPMGKKGSANISKETQKWLKQKTRRHG